MLIEHSIVILHKFNDNFVNEHHILNHESIQF